MTPTTATVAKEWILTISSNNKNINNNIPSPESVVTDDFNHCDYDVIDDDNDDNDGLLGLTYLPTAHIPPPPIAF
jgi:hypothetical protein